LNIMYIYKSIPYVPMFLYNVHKRIVSILKFF
jgi:hypothetical protein